MDKNTEPSNFKLTARQWLTNNAASAIIIVLLLFILFSPKALPEQKGLGEEQLRVADAAPSTPSVHATTQPTSQPAIINHISHLPLYDLDDENGDPAWSLPTEINGQEVQSRIQQVLTLEKELPRLLGLKAQCAIGVTRLFQDELIGKFWDRRIRQGFRDKNLPLDWYQVVKDRNSLLGTLVYGQMAMAENLAMFAVFQRLNSVRVRLIGGQLALGDALFLKTVQSFVDYQGPHYAKLLPLIKSVGHRTNKEFALRIDVDNLNPNDQMEDTAPLSEEMKERLKRTEPPE